MGYLRANLRLIPTGLSWHHEAASVSQPAVRPWLLGLALIYLSMLVLVVGMAAMHIHADEQLVFDWTRKDLGYVVTYLAQQDVHPPLWFSSFWLWRQFVGDSEFAGRLLSVFFSLITLSLVYQVGRRWLGAPRYGLFAVALLGVNSYFFIYALEIRPYALIMLIGTASMWSFQRWLTRQTWRSALFYALTLGVMLYVHYFMFVLMIVQALIFVLRRPGLRLIRQGLGIAALAVLIWLPWLPVCLLSDDAPAAVGPGWRECARAGRLWRDDAADLGGHCAASGSTGD